MAYSGDTSEQSETSKTQNEEIIAVLKAILSGIEIIADKDPGEIFNQFNIDPEV